MAEHVRIFEMSPRDGLQNEARIIPTAQKIELVNHLSACGFERIETASFVSPKWVPQMADGAEVLAGITRRPGVRYTGLTPNMQGFERAVAAGVDEVAVFASASEGFSKSNLNCSIAESLERMKPVVQAALKAGIPARGYVSCVTDCPFDGPTPPAAVAKVARDLIAMGCYEISLGDTIGTGTPETIAAMLAEVLDDIDPDRLAAHYHDTGGRALDNIEVSLERGLRVVDASVGGLGGCPFAKSATGNVDTLAVVERLNSLRYESGLDAARLKDAAEFAKGLKHA